jgi:hypothetical protein
MEDIGQFLVGIQKSIENSRENLNTTQDFVNDLDKTQANLRKVLEKLDSAIDRVNSDEFVRENVEIAFDLIRNSKNSIFVENAAQALLFSSEFNHSVFANNLIQSVSQEESIHVSLNYAGLNSTIIVDNNLNEVAGSLEDWGRAVLEVRDSQGGSKTSPERASQSWAVMFRNRLSSSPWAGIEQRRIQFAGKPAPYWEILDKGHANIRLVSDRGGYATPSEAPTRFVDKTTEDLQELFKKQLINIKRSITRAKNKLIKQTNTAKNLLLELDELFFYVEENSAQLMGEISDEPVDTEVVVNRVIERLSKVKTSIDKEKLRVIVSEVLETGQISSYNLTSEGRVEVTAKGSRGRARISLNVLLQMIAEG